MSRRAIREEVLQRAIGVAPRLFTTKDISEDDRVIRAHSELVHHRNYHAFVGGALSDHHLTLRIFEVKKRTRRGSLWQKV